MHRQGGEQEGGGPKPPTAIDIERVERVERGKGLTVNGATAGCGTADCKGVEFLNASGGHEGVVMGGTVEKHAYIRTTRQKLDRGRY